MKTDKRNICREEKAWGAEASKSRVQTTIDLSKILEKINKVMSIKKLKENMLGREIVWNFKKSKNDRYAIILYGIDFE